MTIPAASLIIIWGRGRGGGVKRELDAFSLSQAFLSNTELKIFGRHWTCLTHKRSTTELRQPAGKQTLQFCIYTVKGYCYATVLLSVGLKQAVLGLIPGGDQIFLVLYC